MSASEPICAWCDAEAGVQRVGASHGICARHRSEMMAAARAEARARALKRHDPVATYANNVPADDTLALMERVESNGKRWGQVVFSLVVLVLCGVVGAAIGAGVAIWGAR